MNQTAIAECGPEPRKRTKNDLGTPRWLIDLLEQKLGKCALDPCSNPWSVVDPVIAISKDDGGDGLAECWRDVGAFLPQLGDLGVRDPAWIFCNPPYGRGLILPWVEKAIKETAIYGEPDQGTSICVTMLLPGRQSAAWFREARAYASAMAYFDRRIDFAGGAHQTGQIESTAFHFGRGGSQFCDALHSVCDVRLLKYDWR